MRSKYGGIAPKDTIPYHNGYIRGIKLTPGTLLIKSIRRLTEVYLSVSYYRNILPIRTRVYMGADSNIIYANADHSATYR